MVKYKDFFEYVFRANNEAIKCVSSVECNVEKVLSVFSHILNADILRLGRIKNTPQNTGVSHVYQKEELAKVNLETGKMISEFLNDKDFNPGKVVFYKNTKGESFESTVDDILIHLINHSSCHRGQVIHLLSSSRK